MQNLSVKKSLLTQEGLNTSNEEYLIYYAPLFDSYPFDHNGKTVFVDASLYDKVAPLFINLPINYQHNQDSIMQDKTIGYIKNVIKNTDGFTTKEKIFVTPDNLWWAEYWVNKNAIPDFLLGKIQGVSTEFFIDDLTYDYVHNSISYDIKADSIKPIALSLVEEPKFNVSSKVLNYKNMNENEKKVDNQENTTDMDIKQMLEILNEKIDNLSARMMQIESMKTKEDAMEEDEKIAQNSATETSMDEEKKVDNAIDENVLQEIVKKLEKVYAVLTQNKEMTENSEQQMQVNNSKNIKSNFGECAYHHTYDDQNTAESEKKFNMFL